MGTAVSATQNRLPGAEPRDPKKDEAADLKRRIDMARAEAQRAPFDARPGPEWPSADEYTLEEACTELTVAMYTQGAKISLGCTADATSIWARISYPSWSSCKGVGGQSAMTFSGDVGRALRKLCQLSDDPVQAKFRPDPYAK